MKRIFHILVDDYHEFNLCNDTLEAAYENFRQDYYFEEVESQHSKYIGIWWDRTLSDEVINNYLKDHNFIREVYL